MEYIMLFKKFANGRYYADATDQNGRKLRYSTPIPPSEVKAWEESDTVTHDGRIAIFPMAETVEVKIKDNKMSIHKPKAEVADEVLEVNWID